MNLPLNGIKVLDLSMFLSGPRCSQMLADYGAEVVKLEPPSGETMRMWMNLIPGLDKSMTNWHRSKKDITLNIRSLRGAEILKKLVTHFDVIIDNQAPGTMDKYGIGYESLAVIHPGLVFVSITGFGKEGPYSNRVAFDIIAQATSGIMQAQGVPDRSPGVFFGDFVAGAYAAFATLTALRHRDETGEGQLVDVSMQDVMYFHNFPALNHRYSEMAEDDIKQTMGNKMSDLFTSEEGMPFWRPYKAKDGYVAVVFLTDRQWKAMCDLMGQSELKTDERFSNLITRVRNRDAIKDVVNDWMSGRKASEIEKLLDEARIPCGIIKTTEQVNEDVNLKARGMISEVEGLPTPGLPFKLSKSPGSISSPAPELGQHNGEIYTQVLGLSDEDIAALKNEGVI